ncbi:MAG: hypothetical protein ACRD19_15000 [Terriglobia bacterium]
MQDDHRAEALRVRETFNYADHLKKLREEAKKIAAETKHEAEKAVHAIAEAAEHHDTEPAPAESEYHDA